MYSRVKMQRLRLLLVFEASIFVIAALVHVGIFSAGLRDSQAFAVDLLMVVIFTAGVAMSLNRPRITRDIAIFVHGAALLLAVTGLTYMAMGEEAMAKPGGLGFHVVMLLVLIRGFLASRKPIIEVF